MPWFGKSIAGGAAGRTILLVGSGDSCRCCWLLVRILLLILIAASLPLVTQSNMLRHFCGKSLSRGATIYGGQGSSTIRSCAFLSGGDRRRRNPGRLLDLQQRTLLWSSTTDRSFASSNAHEIKPRASNNDVYESSMDVVSPPLGISSAEPELEAPSAVPKPLNGNIRAPPAVNEDGTMSLTSSRGAKENDRPVSERRSVSAGRRHRESPCKRRHVGCQGPFEMDGKLWPPIRKKAESVGSAHPTEARRRGLL